MVLATNYSQSQFNLIKDCSLFVLCWSFLLAILLIQVSFCFILFALLTLNCVSPFLSSSVIGLISAAAEHGVHWCTFSCLIALCGVWQQFSSIGGKTGTQGYILQVSSDGPFLTGEQRRTTKKEQECSRSLLLQPVHLDRTFNSLVS